jgi:hypothetical protein
MRKDHYKITGLKMNNMLAKNKNLLSLINFSEKEVNTKKYIALITSIIPLPQSTGSISLTGLRARTAEKRGGLFSSIGYAPFLINSEARSIR